MTKIKVTAQQRANAIEARDVMWPSVPPENVLRNLAFWWDDRTYSYDRARQTDCGTIACFGGWCARWPRFVHQQKIVLDPYGAPTIGANPENPTHYGYGVAARLFGRDPELFSPRGNHPADGAFGGTDHALVTRRLNWLIENSEVV